MSAANKKNILEAQVAPSHYFNLNYHSKNRWMSWWYQIDEVVNHNSATVLEIGVGNKTVSEYLKKIGFKVTTCDIDKSLKPDVVADIRKLPFRSKSFELILCAEVLEHLPFKYFQSCLRELYRVTTRYVVISLPHFSITDFYLGIKLIPYIPKKEFSLKVDMPIEHKFLGEHYWEIGKRGYSLQKIKKQISKSGFKLEKSYYPKENPRHHFFILERND